MYSPSHLVEIYLQSFQCHSVIKCIIIHSKNVVSAQIPENNRCQYKKYNHTEITTLINEPRYLVKLNCQTKDKQLGLWLAWIIRKKMNTENRGINPHKPESRRPEGCLWINTDVRSIYPTYFMIIFLRDLDKNENTYAYLSIIKIKPSFRCLFYHHSIIKMFCLREQSTSHVHAHTSIELKKKQ